MGLAELIMNTPTRAYRGVRSKAFRWPNAGIADRARNLWHDFKYNTNRGIDRGIRLAKKTGLDKIYKYSGLRNLSHLAVEGIGIPPVPGVGGAPAHLQDAYCRRFNRPIGAPTRNSIMWGLVDTAISLYGASLLGGLGIVGKAAGTTIAAYKWAGLGEIAGRAAYHFTTGKNIGMVVPKLLYETGRGYNKIANRINGNGIPKYEVHPNTYKIPTQITDINPYTRTRRLKIA